MEANHAPLTADERLELEERRHRLEAALVRKERQRDRLVVILLVLLIVVALNSAWTSYDYYVRSRSSADTLTGLEQLAQRGNCAADRTDAFQRLEIRYATTASPEVRRRALAAFNRLPSCPAVQIDPPTTSTSTTTTSRPTAAPPG